MLLTPISVQFDSTMEDISFGLETIPISLASESKQDVLPEFTYVKECVGGPGININTGSPFYPGCQCETDCLDGMTKCSCLVKYGPLYQRNGRNLVLTDLQLNDISRPMFECNSNCGCSSSCCNRLVQKGIHTKVQVFRTSGKGWGVQTFENLQKGQFICEYAGEIISHSEAKKRTEEAKDKPNYIITLREHVAGGKILRTIVDPCWLGNVGRFLNHSCDPNLIMMPVRVDSLLPKLALFAWRDIQAGEELSFSYSGGGLTNDTEELGMVTEQSRKLCLCKSISCTGYLPFAESLF